MNDLLKKLNILIKAGMNDILDEAQKAAAAPKRVIPPGRLGAAISNEVGELRKQVNRALDYEDELRGKINAVQREIDDLDTQADEAVARNDEVNARYYLERMYRAQQRKAMLEADLREHHIATRELMQRVNELDATIAEAQYREQQQAEQAPPPAAAPVPPQQPELRKEPDVSRLERKPPPPPPQSTTIPVEVTPDAEPEPESEDVGATRRVAQETDAYTEPKAPVSPDVPAESEVEKPPMYHHARELSEASGKMLSDVLREARETVAKMGDLIEAQEEVQQSGEPAAEAVADEVAHAQVDDDIAARRARLSAPPKPRNQPDNEGS